MSSAIGETGWFDPALIEFKISPCADLQGRKGGDWDLERRHVLSEAVKYRAIRQHFIDGRDWEETDLFRDNYARRFASGDNVRGAASIDDLAAQYRERVDGLRDQMRREGFRLTDKRGKPHPLPGLLIGRGGEVFIGNQGNHRLAIAKVIGLDRIAGRITCSHKQAPHWRECPSSRP